MLRKPSLRQILVWLLGVVAAGVVAVAVVQTRADLEMLDYTSAVLSLLLLTMGARVSVAPPQKHQTIWQLTFILLGSLTVCVSLYSLGHSKRAERERDALSKETISTLQALKQGIGTMDQEALRGLIDDVIAKQLPRGDGAGVPVPPSPARSADSHRTQPAAPQKASSISPQPVPQQSSTGPVTIPDLSGPTDLPIAFVGDTQVDARNKPAGHIYVSVLISQATRYRGTIDDARVNRLLSQLRGIPGVDVFFAPGSYLVSKGKTRVSFWAMRSGPGVYYFDRANESIAAQILNALPTDIGIKRTELVDIPSSSEPRTDFMTASGIDVEVIL